MCLALDGRQGGSLVQVKKMTDDSSAALGRNLWLRVSQPSAFSLLRSCGSSELVAVASVIPRCDGWDAVGKQRLASVHAGQPVLGGHQSAMG